LARKKTTTIDPRQLAAHYARDWFAQLLETKEAFSAGSVYQAGEGLENGFAAVQKALECEDIKIHGEPRKDDERSVRQERCAGEAGYLIGLQIGLRLRNVDGGR
jgi:hypothetical protein